MLWMESRIKCGLSVGFSRCGITLVVTKTWRWCVVPHCLGPYGRAEVSRFVYCAHLQRSSLGLWFGSSNVSKSITNERASEMAQNIKHLLSKPRDLSSIPGTHCGDNERTNSTKSFSDLHVCTVTCTPHTHTPNSK